MSILRRLVSRFRWRRAERELDLEIRFHLEQETERNLARGLAPEVAARQARRDFGPIEVIKEAHRDARGVRWLDDLAQDLRHAWRSLRRDRVVAFAATVTLALGIGANIAIYSAVDAVLVRPLPVRDPSSLVMLWESNAERGWNFNVAAPANMFDWKDEVPGIADVAAYEPYVQSLTMSGVGEPRVLRGYPVTGNFFSLLGVRPVAGHVFAPRETWSGGVPNVMISQRVWHDIFGNDPRVIGRSIQLDAVTYQVIGVVPASFRLPEMDGDLWITMAWDPTARSATWFRRAHFVRPIARLRHGVSPAVANAQLQVVAHRLQKLYPATNATMHAGLTPLHAFLVRDMRRPLVVLLGAVALLLLISCVNVGTLLLVRALAHAQESSIRLALGARRGRLVRQAATETLFLLLVGGVSGLLLGWAGVRAVHLLAPADILPAADLAVNLRVLWYAIAVTATSGVLFGVVPACWSGTRTPGEVLRHTQRSRGPTTRQRRWSGALIAGELALALLLLVGAGLLVRSFQRLINVDPGFDPHGVLAVSINLPSGRYDSARRINTFYRTLLNDVGHLPSVRSAALTTNRSLSGSVGWTSDFSVEGRAPDAFGTEVAHRAVTPDYFRTMRVPIIAGRAFTPADDATSPPVVLINRALAREYFAGQNPIGQRIAFDRVPDSASVWRTIVGVVGDERQSDLATPSQIELITPADQQASSFMTLLVRAGSGDPLGLVPGVRRAVAALDPTIGFASVQTMDAVRSASLARARFFMTMLIAFAVAGLVLALVGVYGLMARAAQQRVAEMGIRSALGASVASLQWRMIGYGMVPATIGVAAGLVVAGLTSPVTTTLLFEITPRDLVTFAAAPGILLAAATLASWLPARRAAHSDPMAILKGD